MTNRLDMLDDALLRPGRLEVHMEVGLPDAAGRQQIWKIHTSKVRFGQIQCKAKRVISNQLKDAREQYFRSRGLYRAIDRIKRELYRSRNCWCCKGSIVICSQSSYQGLFSGHIKLRTHSKNLRA